MHQSLHVMCGECFSCHDTPHGEANLCYRYTIQAPYFANGERQTANGAAVSCKGRYVTTLPRGKLWPIAPTLHSPTTGNGVAMLKPISTAHPQPVASVDGFRIVFRGIQWDVSEVIWHPKAHQALA